jgi:hypothetical protein
MSWFTNIDAKSISTIFAVHAYMHFPAYLGLNIYCPAHRIAGYQKHSAPSTVDNLNTPHTVKPQNTTMVKPQNQGEASKHYNGEACKPKPNTDRANFV